MSSIVSMSSGESSSYSVTPAQPIDEILKTKNFDLSRLIAHGLFQSGAEASNIADEQLPYVERIANEIKKYSGNIDQTSIGVLTAIENVHWAAVGFFVVAAVLKIVDAGTIENNECFKSMNDLSKVILQLQLQNLPDSEMELHTELNESIRLIVKGAILCCSVNEREGFERGSKALRDGQELQHLIKNIDDMCKILRLQKTISALRGVQSNLDVSPQPIPTFNQDADLQRLMELAGSSTSTARQHQMETEKAFDVIVPQVSASSSTPMNKRDRFKIGLRGGGTKLILTDEISEVTRNYKGAEILSLVEMDQTVLSKSSINRVPQDLRSLREEAFNPKIVGLGIYHYRLNLYSLGKEKVKVFSSGEREEKEKALWITSKRLKGITASNLVAEIQKLAPQIRNCYGESTGSFAEEILALNFAMDACFILENFRLLYCRSDRTIQREIMTDIFKLENQIPLLILLRILELEFDTGESAISSLADILCMHPQFSILPFCLKPMESRILKAELKANIEEKPSHLLHLLSKIIETFLRPSNISTGETTMDTDADIVNDWTDFMSTVVNRDADIVEEFLIRFKPSKDGQVRFKKGWFGSGVLYLPKIYLFEETEPLLWNLIAFAAGSENIIGHFMIFLKCVICSNSKSVALLRKAEIIITKRSDEELYTMFNNLSNVIGESCGPFENGWSQARQHYGSPINKWTLWFTCLVFRFAVIGFCLAFLFAISGCVNTHFVLVSVSVLAVSLLLFHGFRLHGFRLLIQLGFGLFIQLERPEIQEGELREIQEGELPEKQKSERELHERLERRELQEGELPEKQDRERELHERLERSEQQTTELHERLERSEQQTAELHGRLERSEQQTTKLFGRLERSEQQTGELHERLERERLVWVEGQVQRSGTSKREVVRHGEKFSFPDLSHATGGFSEESKLGSGSFGTVYLGTLPDGRKVAIKRGDAGSAKKYKENEYAFESELSVMAQLCHKHLVGLVGYCEEANERLLVYDYMPHGSLHDHLHKAATINPPLDSWAMRIKIALDAARGIEYLHNYAVRPIIHRDIKSSNILLDGSWNAKVSDFGLSLLGPMDEDSHLSLMAAGTVGYIDPEYYKMQRLTTKSDVYSYGIVLMELLTGKKAIHKHDGSGGPRNVVDYAAPYIVHDDLPTILDDRLVPPGPYEIEAVTYVGYTAMDCVNLEGKDRPSMTEIVNSLETALAFCSQAEVSVSRTRSPPRSDDNVSVL